jgi:hypothetical protein
VTPLATPLVLAPPIVLVPQFVLVPTLVAVPTLYLVPPQAHAPPPAGRGLHSSISQLNLSVFYGIVGARRGCVARVKGVSGGV